MSQKNSAKRNAYRCTIEVNQNGKYCIRLRATFARHPWELAVYFLASSFDRALKKLEQTLQYLQRNEEKLWFWGVDRSDDPQLAGEMLAEEGLHLDKRSEFPKRAASVSSPPEKPIPGFLLAPLRRALTESVSATRAAAVASD